MRSLQIRLPLIAIAVLALSLAVSAFIVFEALLLTSQGRLDDSIEGESLRLREFIALASPAALDPAQGTQPSSGELAATVERFLEQDARSNQYMTVVRIGERILTTPDAPAALELLRESNRLPDFDAVTPGQLRTVDTPEGAVRLLGFELLAADEQASAVVIGSLGDVRSRAFIALGRISAAAGIGLLLAGALLAWVIRRMLRPLNELATAARDAELEHLGERVELRGRADEVGELAREFNRMLDRLEKSVFEQRRFMSAISHELRTPITIARGHLDLLDGATPERLSEQAPEAIGLVRNELMRMQRLVADLMALGRAADDDFVLTERTSLRDFFDELLLRVVGLGTPNVVIEPAEDITIIADPDRLAQAMLNLIVNAHLHARSHTTIRVGCTTNPDNVAFFVRDDGAGVDPSIRDTLFEPFVKAEGNRGSTGLGLSVVSAIAEAHQGAVWLDTGSDGTMVSVIIPMRPAPARRPPQRPSERMQPALIRGPVAR